MSSGVGRRIPYYETDLNDTDSTIALIATFYSGACRTYIVGVTMKLCRNGGTDTGFLVPDVYRRRSPLVAPD